MRSTRLQAEVQTLAGLCEGDASGAAPGTNSAVLRDVPGPGSLRCALTRLHSPARTFASGSGHATTTRSNNSIAATVVVPRTIEHETWTLFHHDDRYASSTHSTCTAAESGLQLLERLWRALQAASAADAPLARWLFLGALRPWLAAARTWVFTASPTAPQAWQPKEHIRMPYPLQRTVVHDVRVSLAFVTWSCMQDALWSVCALSTVPSCFHAVRCSVNIAESA